MQASKFQSINHQRHLRNCNFVETEITTKSSNFLNDAEQWLKKIQEIMHQSFTKIRLTGKGKASNPELDNLMKAKQMLRNKLGEASGLNPHIEKEISN